ncbi:hypothetical protein E2C01_060347 [Portunus trituberculatus]|uniref:Uncharacterized protein n=1 Tax=Portunus trituberculatus TaxID=210409 RepID=A0A5B7H0X1_PORTR|nr:hypothetical protein [Portunus trituberculatus]
MQVVSVLFFLHVFMLLNHNMCNISYCFGDVMNY